MTEQEAERVRRLLDAGDRRKIEVRILDVVPRYTDAVGKIGTIITYDDVIIATFSVAVDGYKGGHNGNWNFEYAGNDRKDCVFVLPGDLELVDPSQLEDK